MQPEERFKFYRVKKWTWILILSLTIILSWFSLQNINYTKLFELFKRIDYFWILLSCIPIVLAALLQSYRWREAVRSIEEKQSIPALFRAMMIGNAFNNILPKGGELIKPYVYAKRRNLKYSSVLATSGIDRYYDLIGLVLFLVIVIIIKQKEFSVALPQLNLTIILIMGIILSLSIMLIMLFLLKSKKPNQILTKLLSKFPEKISKTVLEKFEYFTTGLKVVDSLKAHLKMSAWTVLVWIMHTLNLWIAFYAFDFQSINPLDFYDAMAFLIAISLGITFLPIPGGTGVQHYVIKTMMVSLFFIDQESAFAYAAINHACVYFVNLFVGFICIIPEYKNLFPKESIN